MLLKRPRSNNQYPKVQAIQYMYLALDWNYRRY